MILNVTGFDIYTDTTYLGNRTLELNRSTEPNFISIEQYERPKIDGRIICYNTLLIAKKEDVLTLAQYDLVSPSRMLFPIEYEVHGYTWLVNQFGCLVPNYNKGFDVLRPQQRKAA